MKSPLHSLAALVAVTTFAAAQGSLTPPAGPPGPVMKTLDQVEARIPLTDGQPGVSVDPGSGTITISQPGSYYLTKEQTITSPGANGITISSGRVTLDLNGYALNCTLVNGGSAIATSGASGISVRNGFIHGGTVYDGANFTYAGWQHGVASNAGDVRISDLTVRGVRQNGISAGEGIVSGVLVDTCGGTGITASTVLDSTVRNVNGTAISINIALGGGLVENCLATSVGPTTGANGIYALLSQVNNSRGGAKDGTGIRAAQVSNSRGHSLTGVGIIATCATNCFGSSDTGTYGMDIEGTASFCRGDRFNGTAIKAGIAIGCTMESGSLNINSAQKHLGTP